MLKSILLQDCKKKRGMERDRGRKKKWGEKCLELHFCQHPNFGPLSPYVKFGLCSNVLFHQQDGIFWGVLRFKVAATIARNITTLESTAPPPTVWPPWPRRPPGCDSHFLMKSHERIFCNWAVSGCQSGEINEFADCTAGNYRVQLEQRRVRPCEVF